MVTQVYKGGARQLQKFTEKLRKLVANGLGRLERAKYFKVSSRLVCRNLLNFLNSKITEFFSEINKSRPKKNKVGKIFRSFYCQKIDVSLIKFCQIEEVSSLGVVNLFIISKLIIKE